MGSHRFVINGDPPFCGILHTDDAQCVIIEVGGKSFRLYWSNRWGPSLADKHGDIAEKQPGPRHEFWRAASLWNRQGQRIENGVAVWHEPAPEIVRRVGRRDLLVVQHGEDPDYSRFIVLPAESDPPLRCGLGEPHGNSGRNNSGKAHP